MYLVYSILLTLGSIVLSPLFVFDAIFKGKYVHGFIQRLGSVATLPSAGRDVIWVHCVSVGETNAARPLISALKARYPNSSVVVSTTTRTGQMLARELFAAHSELVFYFPFDWRWAVRRTLGRIKPTIVLLMETELWPNFIRETSKQNIRIGIVNGRLSPRSYRRFGYVQRFVRRVLGYLDIALMQEKADATRLMALGLRASKVRVTGNLKFDNDVGLRESALTESFRERFAISPDEPLIIAASTHAPEERYVLDAFKELFRSSSDALPRLMIAPRHPERFDEVAELIKRTGFAWVRRSADPSPQDRAAEIILLDSIGELRSAYPLAEVVFVGGSLIPHGGQSIFEPAAAGRAVVTGSHMVNFEAATEEFAAHDAIIQLAEVNESGASAALVKAIGELLGNDDRRRELGSNAEQLMKNSRGAVDRTIEYLSPLIDKTGTRRSGGNHGCK